MAGDQSRADRRVSLPIGIVSALVCLLIVIVRGGNPVAIKVVLRSLSPMQGAFSRVAIACAGVGIFAVAQGVELKPKRSEMGPLALLSFVYALQIGANQTGADYTSPVLVAVLFNTYPVVGNLVSSLVVPEDRLNLRRIIGLAVAFAGVVWVFLSRTESPLAPNPMLGNSLVPVRIHAASTANGLRSAAGLEGRLREGCVLAAAGLAASVPPGRDSAA